MMNIVNGIYIKVTKNNTMNNHHLKFALMMICDRQTMIVLLPYAKTINRKKGEKGKGI